ncbi:hypothetical protein ACOZDE_19165 [Streptomyces griseoincarnatus]
MPTRTTIAAVSGLVSGICLAAAAVEGIQGNSLARLLAQTIAVGFFPTVVVSLVAVAILRRQMARHEVRSRRDVEAAAQLRRQTAAEFDRRAAELREREERLNCQAALTDGQTRTLVEQLREARAQRDEAIRQRDRIQADFDALADEYNGMVLDEVDDRSAQFARQRTRRPADRERRREPATVEGCPQVSHIIRQPQPEQEQHARPAEG